MTEFDSSTEAYMRSASGALRHAVEAMSGRGPLYRAIAYKVLTDCPVGLLHVPPTRTSAVVRARRRASVGVLWIADNLEAVALRMRR